MHFYARQGDLVIDNEHYNKPPDGATFEQATAPLVLSGRDSDPHTIEDFQALKVCRRGDLIFLQASRKVVASHAGRHQPVELAPGEYVIFPLSEFDGDLRSVED